MKKYDYLAELWDAFGLALVGSTIGYLLSHIVVAWICGSFARAVGQ